MERRPGPSRHWKGRKTWLNGGRRGHPARDFTARPDTELDRVRSIIDILLN